MPETKYTNRLIYETSPYLRQHAHNPVDWYPWGAAAFQKAKQEDKPLLLSCGYSACHWCHVMERESFEDPEIAALMNRYFVNIKVDREERPDIDQIYQQAVQLLTGQGGWPLTVFLDHDGKPFFGGTYFPPRPLYGRSSFPQVLEAIHQKWTGERETISRSGREIGRYLQDGQTPPDTAVQDLPEDLPVRASLNLYHHYDREYGGFGTAPKFPTPSLLQLLCASGVLDRQPQVVEAVLFTLEQMARGGIYDQLGGGFHRYATDRYWLVPHFEKMLYDNGQLLKLYAIGYQLRPNPDFQAVVAETAAYLRREMQSPEGGFYATQDADSEGVEGKYYVWRIGELQQELTPAEFELVRIYYNVTEDGNFEGSNILNRMAAPGSPAAQVPQEILVSAKRKLFSVRERRVKPFLDRKIIVSWNGLAISGLAYAYQVLGRDADYHGARQAAEFLLNRVRLGDGSRARIFINGQAKVAAMLDDYSFLAQGLLDLYEADFDSQWLEKAVELTSQARERFGTREGIYYLTAAGGETLAARPVSRYDQGIPSGVSVQASNLLRLAAFTGKTEWQADAEQILKAYSAGLERKAWGCAGLITQLALLHHGMAEFVFLSKSRELPELLQKLRRVYIPNRVLAWTPVGQDLTEHPARELFQGRQPVNDATTCYICVNRQCHPPVTGWSELVAYLSLS